MIQEKHAGTLKRPIFGKTAFAMKRYILAALMMLAGLAAAAQTYTVTFGKGQVVLEPMDDKAAKVSLEGSTLMRPFVFDFPDDEEALRQQHSFMLGESLLVCPVTEPGVSRWKVYLPEHEAGWYDFVTGERYDGGQYIEIPVTIESIPVFAKGGSIIPLAAELQHSGELQSITADGKINESQITLKVFPGADAAFVLYEDDGVSCAYENGQYRTVTIRWDERRQKLECLSL